MRLGQRGGIGTGYKLDDIENYVNSFNWFENWFNNYFFTKFSDYILVILIVSLIFYLIIQKKKINQVIFKKKIKINIIFFYLSICFVFSYLVFNFPTLRYAGYSISFYLIILPICFIISKYDISNEKIL